jgi:hypothetical protein
MLNNGPKRSMNGLPPPPPAHPPHLWPQVAPAPLSLLLGACGADVEVVPGAVGRPADVVPHIARQGHRREALSALGPPQDLHNRHTHGWKCIGGLALPTRVVRPMLQIGTPQS